MPLPSEVTDWIARSEVDHIGPFVNAWAAFNAWYRHVSQSTQDREGLKYVRTHPNSVRGAILPILDPLTEDTPDAKEFKVLIAKLHGALEAYRLETVYKGKIETVSLRSVPIKLAQRLPYGWPHNGLTYEVLRQNQLWVSRILNRAGGEVLRIEQQDYDLVAMTADVRFQTIRPAQQGQMRAAYAACNPRPMVDLLNGSEPPIRAGTITFGCTCEDLFGGLIETIYRMRNMLLHGELKPHDAALACYEPAYYLLRRMLKECR
jgi:hypothetical protein